VLATTDQMEFPFQYSSFLLMQPNAPHHLLAEAAL
jgi:hypothetical protein